MPHHLLPEDLQNEENFILLDVVNYKQFKPFILKAIQKKSRLITIYSIVQIIALFVAVLIMAILIINSLKTGELGKPLKWFLIALGCSFTILIPIHELTHALAFLLLGKKDIGFGAQLHQFVFYAEANRQVMDKKEITIVAFAPLVILGIASIVFCLFTSNSPSFYFGIGIFLIHFLFCAGDMAIVSYFSRQKEIYSFDDRKEKCSYFYQKREHNKKRTETMDSIH